jgi:hypothetical protein
MRRLAIIILAAGCGGGGDKSGARSTTPDPARPTEPTGSTERDQRVVHLQTMTKLLVLLADEVEKITAASPASTERCSELSAAVVAWGDAHYEEYETADAEGTFLGLTEKDVGDEKLRGLARQLARSSSELVEMVDEDCLYGEGAYGDALYEYLVAYQGLAHWVREGDPAAWDYEALIEEPT